MLYVSVPLSSTVGIREQPDWGDCPVMRLDWTTRETIERLLPLACDGTRPRQNAMARSKIASALEKILRDGLLI